MFDNLIHTGEMPVTIGLFINPGKPGPEHDPAQHSTRCDQYDVLDDKYSRFLLDEIIPDVVQPLPAHRRSRRLGDRGLQLGWYLRVHRRVGTGPTSFARC